MTHTATHLPTDQTVEILDSIGGVPAGEDHAGEWCLPVRFPDGARRFVSVADLA